MSEKKTDKPEIKEESKEEKPEEKKEYLGKPVVKGDLIKLDMTGTTVPTTTEPKAIVFQATNVEDAQKMSSYDPQKAQMYTPELVMVGEKGFILDKLSEELENMKYGEEKTIQLEAADAFGERDPKQIEKMSRKKFIAVAKEAPRLGMEFHDEKGRHGHVISDNQGRIRVDFNHPLAGRKVEYKLKAIEKIEKFEDKVLAFIGRRMQGAVPELFKVDYKEEEKILDIVVPEFMAFQQNAGYAEFGASYDLQNYLDVETVNFIHSFKKRPEPTAVSTADKPEDEKAEDAKKEEEKPEEKSE